MYSYIKAYIHTFLCYAGTIGQCGADVMNLSLTAWLLESTDDQQDYLRITTKIKTMSQVVGHVLAVGLSEYVPYGYIVSLCIYLVVGTISVVMALRIPPTGKVKEIASQPPILPSIRIAANSSLFRKLVSSFVMLISGRNVVAVAVLYLFQIEDYPEIQTYQDFAKWFFYLTVIATSLGVVSAYLMNKYLKTTDKYYAYRVIIYIYVVMAFVMIPCTIIRSAGSFAIIFTVLCCYAVLRTCVDILRDMMTRDLLLVDEYCTGMNREALFLTVVNVPVLLATTFIGALPLLIIPLSGYKQVDDVDDDKLSSRMEFSSFTIWSVRVMTCVYILFATAGFYFIYGYQINDEKIIVINEQLNLRSQSKGNSDDSKEESIMENSFHVSGLNDIVVSLLNFSPVENRAFGDILKTPEVLPSILRFNQLQLALASSACALLLSLFVYVCTLGTDTYTFLIVFMFLLCSIIGLYAFYRSRALVVLKQCGIDDIAESAKLAEEQRLGDKSMHFGLTEGDIRINAPKNAVTTQNPLTEDEAIGQSLMPPITAGGNHDNSDVNVENYKGDNYMLDNTTVVLLLGAVNVAVIATFCAIA